MTRELLREVWTLRLSGINDLWDIWLKHWLGLCYWRGRATEEGIGVKDYSISIYIDGRKIKLERGERKGEEGRGRERKGEEGRGRERKREEGRGRERKGRGREGGANL